MNTIKKSIGHLLLDLLYPPNCLACHRPISGQLDHICVPCLSQLTPLDFGRLPDNPLTSHFYGRCKLTSGIALFGYFPGGRVQHLIQNIKYKSKLPLAFECGQWLGKLIQKSPSFNDVDGLVPVPLHPKKLKIRGYNQSAIIAQGIASVCDIPVLSNLITRRRHTPSQTLLNRLERCNNMNAAFYVDADPTSFNHLLLIDDVVTTGATLEACINAIHSHHDARFSIGCLAVGGL